MQFLLMCCFDEAKWAGLPESQRRAIMDDYGKLIHEVKASGRLLSGAKLDSCSTAVTVRENDKKAIVLDGPFAETKEQLGGYHLVECRNREEAIAIAKRIPTLPAGGVIEVRPLLHME